MNIIKDLFLAIAILMLSSFSPENQRTIAGQKDDLKGPVKEVKEYVAIQRDSILCKDYLTFFTCYDEDGNRIKRCGYSNDGSLTFKQIIKYNRDGNERLDSVFLEPEWEVSKSYFKYNNDRTESEQFVYLNNSPILRIIKKYDENGKIIESIELRSDGKCDVYNYNNKYDDNGNKIEYSQVFNGKPQWKNTYKYDVDGYKTEYCFYNSDGCLFMKHTYKYDDKGQNIEENAYTPNDSLYYTKKFSYDNDGNQIEICEYNADGSLDHKESYKYDRYGNVSSKVTASNTGIMTEGVVYEYVYY